MGRPGPGTGRKTCSGYVLKLALDGWIDRAGLAGRKRRGQAAFAFGRQVARVQQRRRRARPNLDNSEERRTVCAT